MISTEGIELVFEDSAIEKIAHFATHFNEEMENIGARRLHTVMEKLLEDISFEASDMKIDRIVIDDTKVTEKLQGLSKDSDLAKFIL